MLKTLFISLLSLCFSVNVLAQHGAEEIIADILQDAMENAEEETDISILSDYLYDLLASPINLNDADREVLEELPMISETQIVSFLEYRERVKQLYSIYELLEVEHFTTDILERLSPFVVVESPARTVSMKWKDVLRYSKHTFLARGQRLIEQQEGYKKYTLADFSTKEQFDNWKEKRYKGGAWKYYARYNMVGAKEKIKAGVVLEKDAGESFLQENTIDHLSGFVEVNNIGKTKKILIGDFLANWGQGLTVWNGYMLHKSTSVLGVNKQNEGLRKYNSSDENNFFRGVGLTLSPFSNMDLSVYYSNKYKDTNYSKEKESFSSFITSGYHRSDRELRQRKNVNEKLMGANLNYIYNNLKIGANFISYAYDKRYSKKNELRDIHYFRGQDNFNYSAYSTFRFRSIFFFAEWAFDKRQNSAWLAGALLRLEERLILSLLYRDYSPQYYGQYASGFADYSKTNNEQGWYIGVEILPFAKWRIQAYVDIYESSWLRYQKDFPSKGYDFKVKLNYRPSTYFQAYVQYFRENNQKNDNRVPVKGLVEEIRNRLRLHCSYRINQVLTFRDRIEFSSYRKESENYGGILLFHDAVVDLPRQSMRFIARYALFDVENYDTRIYTYENDVLYAYAIPSFQGKGMRFYLNARWELNKKFTFWLKYAVTNYFDRDELYSDMNLIQGNKVQELKLQLRYRF